MKPEEMKVHQAHCCAKHGCKYTHAACPVVDGLIQQKCYCDECDAIIDGYSKFTHDDMGDLYMYCTSFVPEHLLSEMKGFDKYIHDAFLPELSREDETIITHVDSDVEEMKSLIDGVYEIVELFGHKGSPSQKAWTENWLSKARKFGAGGE